ncbi:mei2-like protein [Fusarium sp. NRRL 52700]|nr:mei2-like protein [Fusarium sp. NRRL 52700]
MKRSVENAEHGCSPQLLGSISAMSSDAVIPSMTADGGLAQGSTLSATASSFQPIGQRVKGKNALVFYPEGSPTVAGALSQDMDISQERQNHRACTTQPISQPLDVCIRIQTRPSDPPSDELNNIVDLDELIAGRDVRTTIMIRNVPNKDGQPPSAQVVGVSLSGGPIACFDSGSPQHGADMLPRTVDFGVTPEEARELHRKQQAYDGGKKPAGQDTAVQKDGGIWDGSTPSNNNNPSNVI